MKNSKITKQKRDKNKKSNSVVTKNIVLLAVYFSFFLASGFTIYIGYIPIAGTTITYLPIFVVIATCHLGFKGALVSGLGFGVSSLIAAFLFGSIKYQYPDISILPRVLMALLVYAFYKIFNFNNKPKMWKFLILTLIAVEFNVIFVLSFQHLHNAFWPLKGVWGIPEWIVTHVLNLVLEPSMSIVIALATYKLVLHLKKKTKQWISISF
ncbi:hypothetical protein [Mycoplasmopsis iners]|uniref:hypothetical protein n=1 Tax=Mycoplasmopsis iners TaxID=76630 RepID=UPI00069135A5|nr:hypothetical protein [Mycoplasmopsis iners]